MGRQADKQCMKFFYSDHLSPTLEKSAREKGRYYTYLYITELYYVLFTHLHIGCAISLFYVQISQIFFFQILLPMIYLLLYSPVN